MGQRLARRADSVDPREIERCYELGCNVYITKPIAYYKFVEALQRVGVTTLVSLTTKPVDRDLLARHGIQGLWMPIKDMHAPSVEEAEQMCRQVAALMADGQVVAYHCRAGLGRTREQPALVLEAAQRALSLLLEPEP